MAVSPDRFDPTDATNPRRLTPEQRLDELATLLATGVRRLLALRASAGVRVGDPPEQIDLDSEQILLDERGDKSVHAPGVNATGERRRS